MRQNSEMTDGNDRTIGEALDAYATKFAETFLEVEEWLVDRQQRYHAPGPAWRGVSEWRVLRDLLGAELEQQVWTLDELAVVAGALQGVLPFPGVVVNGLAGEVNDYLIDDLVEASGHSPEEAALLARLGDLGPAVEHALSDAVSRWWATSREHTVEGWTTVGVRVVEAG